MSHKALESCIFFPFEGVPTVRSEGRDSNSILDISHHKTLRLDEMTKSQRNFKSFTTNYSKFFNCYITITKHQNPTSSFYSRLNETNSNSPLSKVVLKMIRSIYRITKRQNLGTFHFRLNEMYVYIDIRFRKKNTDFTKKYSNLYENENCSRGHERRGGGVLTGDKCAKLK